MNREPYANSLQYALTEIKKAYPGIHHSFLFTHNGSILAEDSETDEKIIQNVLESFEDLKEKTKTFGNVKSFSVTGKNGKLFLSGINDMYLVMVTSEQFDELLTRSITTVILPTILKTVETFSSQKPQSPPPPATVEKKATIEQKMVVDTVSGFFAGDSVQIDEETLIDWVKVLDSRPEKTEDDYSEGISHVRVETFAGNSVLCKVKEISDPKLKGKNMIRIPEKVCNTLVIKKGDHVLVKPLL